MSTVAIVKTDKDSIEDSVTKVLDLIGGFDRLIVPFDTVLIKPNWVMDVDYTTGAVTNPNIIKQCTKMALKAAAKKIVIADSSYIGLSTEGAINKSGLLDMQSKRVEIKDFKKSEYSYTVIPNPLRYRRLSIPKEVMEADIIINIPVMKTHDSLPVTLGLKNMKGIVSDKNKRRFHSLGVEEGIIDINKVALPDITIIDGTVGMEGDGPLNGTPANMNVLIASLDPLAAEIVAIKAMGLDPESMRYIQLAYEAGFGEKDINKIDIVGENLECITKKFKTSYYTKKKYEDKNIVVHDEQACSACRDSIIKFMRDIKSRGNNEVHVVAGSTTEFSDEIGYKCRSIGIGKCLYTHKDLFDGYVPGCPPLKKDIKKIYNMLNKEEKDGI